MQRPVDGVSATLCSETPSTRQVAYLRRRAAWQRSRRGPFGGVASSSIGVTALAEGPQRSAMQMRWASVHPYATPSRSTFTSRSDSMGTSSRYSFAR